MTTKLYIAWFGTENPGEELDYPLRAESQERAEQAAKKIAEEKNLKLLRVLVD